MTNPDSRPILYLIALIVVVVLIFGAGVYLGLPYAVQGFEKLWGV